MTEDEIFALYRDSFQPIYADFVSLTSTKPQQILIEQENILTHISQSRNSQVSAENQQENLQKAFNHLVRVTLDMHKLVGTEIKNSLDNFVLNKKTRLAFNLKESEVLQRYSAFIEKARSVRASEMANVVFFAI